MHKNIAALLNDMLELPAKPTHNWYVRKRINKRLWQRQKAAKQLLRRSWRHSPRNYNVSYKKIPTIHLLPKKLNMSWKPNSMRWLKLRPNYSAQLKKRRQRMRPLKNSELRQELRKILLTELKPSSVLQKPV